MHVIEVKPFINLNVLKKCEFKMLSSNQFRCNLIVRLLVNREYN